MFKCNSGLVFTAKVSYQFARARVLHALDHLVTFAIDIFSQNLIIVPIFTSLCQKFPKSEDSHIARALHVHSAPQHPVSWTNEKHSLNSIGALNLVSLAQTFPKVNVSKHNAYAQRTCIAGVLCTLPRNCLYHRITLIELHPCTKFGVNSSKFARAGGPLLNKLFIYWRALSTSYRNGNHKDI